MPYFSEAEKIKDKISQYLIAPIIDIGCADHKITPDAIGIDGRRMNGVNIVTSNLYDLSMWGLPEANTVFSSHTLEHLVNDTSALIEWGRLIKPGGHLILYLPDGHKYSNANNLEHMRDYTYDNFLFYFKRVFCGEGYGHTGEVFPAMFQLIESGEHFGEDFYSFYIVAQKL